MKTAVLMKLLAAAVLVAVPMVAQAKASVREGAPVGISEFAAIGGLIATLLVAAAAAGGAIALSGEETPTSA